MKIPFVLAVLGVVFGQMSFAGASVLKGIDDQGTPCALEILEPRLVRTHYSADMLFEVDAVRLMGARTLITASTQSEFVVIYEPSKKLFTYDEYRSNIRTGEVFFERHRVCYLQ